MKKWKELKYDIRVGIILVPLLVLILSFFADTGSNPSVVEWSYRRCVGINNDGNPDYGWFASKFGEPDSYRVITPTMAADFGKLSVEFYPEGKDEQGNTVWRYYSFTTYDPQHRFTVWRIGVGSTKEQVRRAYRRTSHVETDSGEDIFLDGSGWSNYRVVTFSYDENGLVTSVSVEPGV